MFTVTTFIQYSAGSPSHVNQIIIKKGIQIGKKRSKTVTICRSHYTMYRKPQRCHQKTVKINEFSKVARYKINIQKLIVFPYTITSYQKEKLRKQSYL